MFNRIKIDTIILIIMFFLVGFRVAQTEPKDGLDNSDIEFKHQRMAIFWNNAGMKYYQQKKYKVAAKAFLKSLSFNPDHKLAAYNLACVYALLYEKNPCGDEQFDGSDYQKQAFKYLHIAIRIDPEVPSKASRDKDFNSIKLTIPFLLLTNYYNPLQINSAKRTLIKVGGWFLAENCPGMYGCVVLKFHADNRFSLSRTDSCNFDFDGDCTEFIAGKYSVKSGKFKLIYKSGRIVHYHLPNPDGIILPVEKGEVMQDQDPENCSA